ncbi:MAG TPA: hypothetical protein VMV50_03120 [Candidatus Paceibacterota bacterium]|nr:hypothetical protein [Candidatus Paceibacterota bacterium]
MAKISEHLARVHAKPHHVRKRLAFGIAAGGACAIALIWLSTSLSSGAFALHGSSFAASVGAENVATTSPMSGNENLAGAAGALPSTGAAGIRIVDVHAASSSSAAEQTVIPF